LVSADGVGNGDDPADGFMRNVINSAAEYERELIRSRTRSALAVKKRRGERVGTCPYGYRAGPGGVLVRDAGAQDVIAPGVQLRGSGLTERGVVRALRAEGVRSRSGEPLSQTQVHRLLARNKQSEEDQGVSTMMKDALERSYREAVIENPEWARVTELTRKR